PGLTLQTRTLIDEQIEQDLDAGIADMAIGPAKAVAKRFSYKPLFEEPFACIARSGHPILGDDLTLEKYLACNHAMVAHRWDGLGVVDTALAKLGLSRNVAVCVANFASVPSLIMATDLISVLPQNVAAKVRDELPLIMFELPFEIPSVEVKLIWGKGSSRSPMQKWFRDLVISAAEEHCC
ncbi:MAG: LysR substrate-binding domain-containing protein, partial [Pseudomonadota bacterium]